MYLNLHKQASPINGEKQCCVSAGKPQAGRPRVIHQAGHNKANPILKCVFHLNAITSIVNKTTKQLCKYCKLKENGKSVQGEGRENYHKHPRQGFKVILKSRMKFQTLQCRY